METDEALKNDAIEVARMSGHDHVALVSTDLQQWKQIKAFKLQASRQSLLRPVSKFTGPVLSLSHH